MVAPQLRTGHQMTLATSTSDPLFHYQDFLAYSTIVCKYKSHERSYEVSQEGRSN